MKKNAQQLAIQVLSFLAERGYDGTDDRDKDHLPGSSDYTRVQEAVLDRVQGILQLPSPTSQKQLRAFLGLTGYCRIWTPNIWSNCPALI